MPLIHRRARSPILQKKIETLLDVSPEEYVTEDLPSPIGKQSIASALIVILKARLWKLLQRKLFDRTAARGLKPLSCNVKAFEESLRSQVVLDEGYLANKEPSIVDMSGGSLVMLDEGYCSQEVLLRAAREDDNLLFAEGLCFSVEESWESDLPFGKQEVGMDNNLFGEAEMEMDNDLFWEEMEETHLDKDLSDNGECPTTDDLGYSGVELLDDVPDDIQGRLYSNIQSNANDALYCNIDAELLDDHTHHLPTQELLDVPQRGDHAHSYSQADLTGEDDMLLTW